MSADPTAFASATTSSALTAALITITGTEHVITDPQATRRYRTGYRFGDGHVLAVVRPGSLIEQWQVLKACLQADVIVITQAANTGLTGGSTPDGNDYDRPIVIVNTMRMATIYPIDNGQQVICLPGATLDQLERTLKPLGREPHSVIGSSCLGASVFGGVCNNSGGALVQRGPAYTELALYAQVDASGELHLVNHLGVQLGTTAEDILGRLDKHRFTDADILHSPAAASDRDYASHVRDIDADTPARFNADPRRLHEAAGSAGKLMVFALRLDTFPIDEGAQVFYIGTNDTAELTELRRHILGGFAHLPIAGEYLHRDAFDIAETYGKDMFLLIDRFGTARLPMLFNLKSRCDAFIERCVSRYRSRVGSPPGGQVGTASGATSGTALGASGHGPRPLAWADHLTDKLMQAISRCFPSHLPPRIKAYRQRFDHHLMLKVSAKGAQEAQDYLTRFFANASGDFFACSDQEGRKAFLHRFAAAGAAVRYRAVHDQTVEDIVALDIALRRNDRDWTETLPQHIDRALLVKLYYGHFFCHVFHQDYIVSKGHDCVAIEHEMWALLDRRGAEYPAEHNVGHLYAAKPALKAFYQQLDPCNCFNPGIGQTSKFARYRDPDADDIGDNAIAAD